VATCWSKGDNGGGEGELSLFTGAGSGAGAYNNDNDNKNGMMNYIEEEEEEYNPFDYGTSANALTGNNYGSGGGCVVFSIHLYRGDKRADHFQKRKKTSDIFGSRSSNSRDVSDLSSSRSNNQFSQSKVSKSSRNKKGTEVEYPFQDLYSDESLPSGAPPSVIPSTRTYNSNESSQSTKRSSKVPSSASDVSNQETTAKPDFSHVIIVECMRIRGDTIKFHKDCRAIFASARGDSDGLDDFRSPRSVLYQSPFCFKRMRMMDPATRKNYRAFFENEEFQNEDTELDVSYNDSCDDFPDLLTNLNKTASEMTHSTFSALERILDLLEEDRLDSQLLGVKSLTLMTDERSSGIECSYMTSLCILGSKIRMPNSSTRSNNIDHYGCHNHHGLNGSQKRHNADFSGHTSWTAEKLHQKVHEMAMGQFHSNVGVTSSSRHIGRVDLDQSILGEEDLIDYSNPFSVQTRSSSHSNDDVTTSSIAVKSIESQYVSTIRGYMVHILTNAMSNLIQHSDKFPLLPKPSCFEFMTSDFISKMAEDVTGATRPPMALLGTAHEATHAVKLLHLIASYSEEGFHAVHGAYVGKGSRIRKQPIMELLERAYNAGLSSHHVLKVEARIAKQTLMGHACKDQL
jgi:hypothetical protein